MKPADAVNRRRRVTLIGVLLLATLGVGLAIYLLVDYEQTEVAGDDLQLEQKLDAIQNQGQGHSLMFPLLCVAAGCGLAVAVLGLVWRWKSRGRKHGGKPR
jgi:hypothetical protein